MSRHTARIHALNLVFQFPFHQEWEQNLLKEAFDYYLTNLPDLEGTVKGISPSKEDRSFMEEEVIGTFTHLPHIDAQIEKHLRDWELNRIAKIDLAILRLAVFEINYAADISAATAINEAVELAKVYGTDDSSSFINGVLGQAVREQAGKDG